MQRRFLVAAVLAVVCPVFLTGARNIRTVNGGCGGGTVGGRGISWQEGDSQGAPLGDPVDLSFIDTTTSSLSGDLFALESMASGQWRGDNHSRLVMFSWDVRSFPDNTIPPWPRRRPDNDTPPPPSHVLGSVSEAPWMNGAAFGDQFVVPDEPSRFLRNVDIGFCSARIPWTIHEETIVPNSAAFAGINDIGAGLADQILAGLEDEIAAELEKDNTDWFGPVRVRTNFRVSRRRNPSYRVRYTEQERDEFCARVRLESRGTVRTFIPPFGPATFTPCDMDLDFDVCGNFSVVDERIQFTVNRNEGFVSWDGGGVMCPPVRNRIEDRLGNSNTRQKIEDAITDQLNQELEFVEFRSFTETPLPFSRCMAINPNPCTLEPYSLARAECRFLDGDGAPLSAEDSAALDASLPPNDPERFNSACIWSLPVLRLDLMPSGMSLVFADEPDDPFAEFGTSPLAVTVGTGNICRDMPTSVYEDDFWESTELRSGTTVGLEEDH